MEKSGGDSVFEALWGEALVQSINPILVDTCETNMGVCFYKYPGLCFRTERKKREGEEKKLFLQQGLG